MARKATVTKAIDVAVISFNEDKNTIFQAFTSLVDFDWKAIGALLTKYTTDKPKLQEIKLACAEHSIVRVYRKAGLTITETEASQLARLDGTKDEASKAKLAALTETEKAARKGARNDWFSFTSRIGFKMPAENRGGNNNTTGSNGRARTTVVAKDVPITVESYVPAECADITALRSTYISVKSLLIKLQSRNARVYQGDEGSKLLAIHKNVIELLNGIK